MKPSDVLVAHLSATELELTFSVEPELFWFQGHFPEQAILPGVTQIDWVMDFSRKYLTADYQFNRISQVKFQAPVLPGQRIVLALRWDDVKQLLQFTYYRLDMSQRTPVSTGKIRLCP